MDWITNTPGQALMAFGIILLTIEVVIMGFSTFILTFLGLSAIITGTGVHFNILPSDTLSILISNALLASLFAVLLWKPLKNFQNKEPQTTIKNDLIGLEFVLTQDINNLASGMYRFSGIDWTIKSHETIATGELVVVEKADVGTLWVVKK